MISILIAIAIVRDAARATGGGLDRGAGHLDLGQEVRALLRQRRFLFRQILQLGLRLAHALLARRQLGLDLFEFRPLGLLLAVRRRQFLLGTLKLLAVP